MNDMQLMNELNQTKSLCEEVDVLFGRAAEQGRMLSLKETVHADELSKALLCQIRRIPRRLSLQERPSSVRLQAGEVLDMVTLSLRKFSAVPVAGSTPCPSVRKMAAYTS